MWLIPTVVQQKITQHYKAIILHAPPPPPKKKNTEEIQSSRVYKVYPFALEQAQALSHLEIGVGKRLRKDYASESVNPIPNNRVIPLYLLLFSLIPRSYGPSQLMQGTIMSSIPQGTPIGIQQNLFFFIRRLGETFS